MSEIGAPTSIGVPAQREPVEMTAALDEESDRVALRLAIDAAGVGAFVWNLVTGRLRWDERLLELFGLDESTFGGTIEAFNACVHPGDLDRVSAALERAIATCSDYAAEYRVVLPGGDIRWIEARGRAFSEEPGGPAVRLVGAAYDTSDRRGAQDALARSAQRMSLLASVSDGLTSTLDPVEGVSRLSTLLVPDLADWCLVTLVDDPHASDWRRGLRDVGWSHADPGMRETLRQYSALRLRAMTDASYLARTIREMTPILMESDATAQVAAVLRDGAARDRLHELDPESAVAVPLRARGRTVGVVTVFRGHGRPAFSQDDVALLEDIGARAGLALDNARLYEEQRGVSEALQRSMLTDPPQPDHLQIVTRYSPASEAARIGGDWYDAFLQQNRGPGNNDVVVVVGDVVGHDVEAAAAMGQVRGLLRGIAVHSGYAPAAILSGVDEVMESLRLETTATAVVARLEHHPRPGAAAGEEVVLRWAHAGHPPAMLVAPDGTVTRLADVDDNDLLLGLDPETKRAEKVSFLLPGSILLFYTDGLVERRDRDVQEGIDALAELLGELAPHTDDLDQLCDVLIDRMIGDQPEDDVALLVVRWRPEPAA